MILLDEISCKEILPASRCTVPQEVDRDEEMIVEMIDDPPPQNETEDSEVNNSIFEPTQAKLPPSWGWFSANENQQEYHPTSFKTCAIQFGVVNNITVPFKMVTIVGKEVSYTVKGVLINPPNFLPKAIEKVDDITALLSSFDSAKICAGFTFNCDLELTPSLKKASIKEIGERRSKLCLRILQKGSTCYKCEHLKNLAADMLPKASQMERLRDRFLLSTNSNRLLNRRLIRKKMVIEV